MQSNRMPAPAVPLAVRLAAIERIIDDCAFANLIERREEVPLCRLGRWDPTLAAPPFVTDPRIGRAKLNRAATVVAAARTLKPALFRDADACEDWPPAFPGMAAD